MVYSFVFLEIINNEILLRVLWPSGKMEPQSFWCNNQNFEAPKISFPTLEALQFQIKHAKSEHREKNILYAVYAALPKRPQLLLINKNFEKMWNSQKERRNCKLKDTIIKKNNRICHCKKWKKKQKELSMVKKKTKPTLQQF